MRNSGCILLIENVQVHTWHKDHIFIVPGKHLASSSLGGKSSMGRHSTHWWCTLFCNRSSYPYWMRRIQRLCGLQLVWLIFLDSKWQTGRQITLFCGVSRNDEAIRRVVLSAVYRNSAIALRSIKNHIFGSCPEEHLAFVSDHKRLCTAAVLVGNWRTTCIACLSSPQVANHKSSLSLVDLSIVCGWAVALFCTKTLQMCEWPRAPTASCMK